MRKLAIGIHDYARAHNGAYPARLIDVKDYCPYDQLIENPLTGDNPGYDYVKPDNNSPPDQIMLFQLRDGKRDTSLKVVLVQGAVGVAR